MKPFVETRPGIVAFPGVTPLVSATGTRTPAAVPDAAIAAGSTWSPEKISCGRSLVKTSVVDPSLHVIVRL